MRRAKNMPAPNRLTIATACLVVLGGMSVSGSVPTGGEPPGWPTFRGDIRRSGVSDQELTFPLGAHWTHKPSLPPSPAWPAPAASNLSAESGELVSPLAFDTTYHVVGDHGALYYGSSSDDTVYCLDARTGAVRWLFTTEGPVRLAPAVWQGRVYAGSDDGYVYCLDAADGRLLWKYRGGPEDKRHPGNGRMISMWPIRGGILVDEGTVYFTAGLFPQQGVYLCSLDADTGREHFRESIDQPGQGYLLATPSRLFVPAGRTPCRAYDRGRGTSLAQYGESDSWGRDLVGGCFALLVDDQLASGPSEDGQMHLFNAEGAERVVQAVARRIIIKGAAAYLLTDRTLACYDRTALLSGADKPLKWKVSCRSGSSMILAGDALLVGGPDQVVAHRSGDGAVIWRGTVSGTAESLAISEGRLLVSTDQGMIHCFAAGQPERANAQVEALTISPGPVYPEDGFGASCRAVARAAVDAAGVTRGYCLVLGAGSGRLAYEISTISDFRIIGIEEDLEALERTREKIRGAGLYGTRIVLHHGPLDALPYTKYTANLVVSEATLASGGMPPSPEHVMKVLRPCGGAVVLAVPSHMPESGLARWGARALPGWSVATTGAHRIGQAHRGTLPGAGEWTHFYADPGNTACSQDALAFTPMEIQWYGPPGPLKMVGRHRKTVAPVYRNGRLFISGLDYLVGMDAYNGTVLWEADVPLSARVRANRNSGNMVAAGDSLYIAAGGQCIELDARTGMRSRAFSVPSDAGEKNEWGYIAVVGDTLVGSVTRPLATVRVQLGEGSGHVCSDSLFAVDLPSGRVLWNYTPVSGVIINPAIAIGNGRVYLVESANPNTRNDEDGRMELPELVGQGSRIVALGLETGQPAWQHPAELEALQHAIYLSCSRDTVALTGSKVVTLDGTPRMRYDVRAFDAASGVRLWQSDHAGVNDVSPGDHGNDRQHPAIVGTTLYGSNFACDLRSGEPIEGWKWKKSHKCATLSASANCAFSRFTDAKTPHIFDFSTGEQAALTSITRPGCWINTIPAGGLVLIPEASSGCTCPYPVQTSLALAPKG